MNILPDNPVIIALLLLVGVLIGLAMKSLLADDDDEHNEQAKSPQCNPGKHRYRRS